MGQRVFRLPPAGHVPRIADQRAHGRIIDMAPHHALNPAIFAGRMAITQFDRVFMLRLGDTPRMPLVTPFDVVRMKKVVDAVAEHARRRIPGHLLERWRGVADDALNFFEQDEVGTVFNQGAKQGIAGLVPSGRDPLQKRKREML